MIQIKNTLRSASLKINNKIMNDEEFVLPEKVSKTKKDSKRNIKSNFYIDGNNFVNKDTLKNENDEDEKE